ncbi:MAG: stage III sporulation protein AF [Clostridia bacterium]|nr:stage III sporulation protein AF [Clostridia bacterium]
MSAWVMAIIGVISITVLVDILLPEGETAKYIKGVLSIFVVATIVAPIPAFINKDWSIDNIFSGSYPVVDERYIATINESRADEQQKQIKDFLVNNGYEIVQVVITVGQGNIYIIDRVDVTAGEQSYEDADEIISLIKQRLGDVQVYVGWDK